MICAALEPRQTCAKVRVPKEQTPTARFGILFLKRVGGTCGGNGIALGNGSANKPAWDEELVAAAEAAAGFNVTPTGGRGHVGGQASLGGQASFIGLLVTP